MQNADNFSITFHDIEGKNNAEKKGSHDLIENKKNSNNEKISVT